MRLGKTPAPQQGHATYFIEQASIFVTHRVPRFLRGVMVVFGLLGLLTGAALLLAIADTGDPLRFAYAVLAMLGSASALAGAIWLR